MAPALTTSAAGLVAASHPGPSAVVTAVALGLAVAADLPGPTAVLVVVAVALGQVSIGWSNDWLDARRGWDRGRADKPVESRRITVPAVRAAALGAVAACAVASAALGPAAATAHLVAVAGGWAYNAGVKATPWSALAYVVSFGLLPTVVTAAAGDGPAAWWAWATGACFGAGAHLANALPDLDQDAATGVRGLPQRLGPGWSTALVVVLLAGGAGAVVWGPVGGVGAVGAVGAVVVAALLVVVAAAGARARAGVAYGAAQACGLAVVGLLVLRGDALAG